MPESDDGVHANEDFSRSAMKCTLPFWVILSLSTIVSVFIPVMAGLLLVSENSNTILSNTQINSISANASGLSQLVLERLTAAEGVAHYIASHIVLADHPVDYSSESFFTLLSQALFSFNVTSSACFTDENGNVFGQITSLSDGDNSFLYTDSDGELCRIGCDGACDLVVNKSRAVFCTDCETMDKPWIIPGDDRIPAYSHWVPLFNWGTDSYISFVVTVYKNGVFKGTASVDYALKDIVKLIQFNVDEDNSEMVDPVGVLPAIKENADEGRGKEIPYLVILINRDTLRVLASTDPAVGIGGYDNETDSYSLFSITQYENEVSAIRIVSQYVNESLGGWSNVLNQTSFWSEGYASSLVPIERDGVSFMLIFVVKQMVVQMPAMSIILPIIVTIIIVFFLLLIALIVMNSVMKTSAAMRQLSELHFEKAALKEDSVFSEVYQIQSSFSKLKAATLALTKYVSPVVVKQLLNRRIEEGAAVEMDLMHLSIMFVDMIGLKDNMAETLQKNKSIAFTELLSKWFAVVGNAVEHNRGMIDKFIEDCVMVLFGAPVPTPDNEMDACRTALVLSRRFEVFKKSAGLKNVAAVQFRAGLHSGYVLVGNVGTAGHINYTVCGICANTASRMTELCGKYCLAPLITGDVYEHVKEKYLCAFIDVVLLRGHRYVHTRVYHLMNERERATAEQLKIAEHFSKIHNAMKEGHSKEARGIIEHMLNASWSGKYLTALRILRSRINSRGLTRKMYKMTTVPPNDLTTKTLHYTNEEAGSAVPSGPVLFGALGRSSQRFLSAKFQRPFNPVVPGDPNAPSFSGSDLTSFDDVTIVDVEEPPSSDDF